MSKSIIYTALRHLSIMVLGWSLLQTPIMFFGIFVSIIGPYHQIELIYILTGRRLHCQNWQKYTKQKYKITNTRRKSWQNDTRNVARMLPCHMSWYWMIVLLILRSFVRKVISFKSQLSVISVLFIQWRTSKKTRWWHSAWPTLSCERGAFATLDFSLYDWYDWYEILLLTPFKVAMMGLKGIISVKWKVRG